MRRKVLILLALCMLAAAAWADEAWYCRTCGADVQGETCPSCGGTRETSGLKDGEWVCVCGRINERNYCGKCGRSREEARIRQGSGPEPVAGYMPELEAMRDAHVGDYVVYGRYPQTKEGGDETPIEWLVAARDGDTVTLLSRYVLDSVQYNSKNAAVTWETCSMRAWLNGDFYDAAFSAEEKEHIALTAVTADRNQNYPSMSAGNDTQDRVFLLSTKQILELFETRESRLCTPTEYARAQGVITTKSGMCWQWLRTPGYNSARASGVYYDGSIYAYGVGVYYDYGAVRPAICVSIP